MKKILILTEFYRPNPGGMEGFITGIARNWNKDSVYVCIVSGKSSLFSIKNNHISFDLNETYPLARYPLPRKNFSYFREKQVFNNSISQIVETFQPDHILAVSVSSRFHDLLKSFRIPYSLILNGVDLWKPFSMKGIFYKNLIRNASNIFTISYYLKLQIKKKIPYIPFEKIIVLPPAVDCFVKEKAVKNKKQFFAYGTQNTKIFIALGPLLPWKGIDCAVKAVGMLDEAIREKMHLLIVGSGPDYIYLDELIRLKHLERYVTMTGFVGEEMLASLLNSSHVFIQPNRNLRDGGQGHSLSLMEACCHGLPVITGRTGGVQELVEDEKNGFLVDPENINEISLRMKDFILSDSLRKKMGLNAKKKAKSEFSFKILCSYINQNI
ncbi:MAG: glycosyltransferase family 4 protein [Spirochaetia bacterium]|nr:glycosyltransferase family 4 protein [Spirochaetia bacterium]